MGKKKEHTPAGLVWFALGLFAIAVLIDVWAFFSDNYGRNMLISIPLWIGGILTFAYIGKRSPKK